MVRRLINSAILALYERFLGTSIITKIELAYAVAQLTNKNTLDCLLQQGWKIESTVITTKKYTVFDRVLSHKSISFCPQLIMKFDGMVATYEIDSKKSERQIIAKTIRWQRSVGDWDLIKGKKPPVLTQRTHD